MAWNMEPESRKRAAGGGYYWNPNGSNSMGPNSMGPNSMGPNPMGSNQMGPNHMGFNPMGSNSMGSNSMGSNPMGSMGFNSGFNEWMNSASSMKQQPRGNEPLLKMLIPFNNVGHLLGKGGEYINQLRKSCKGATKVFIAFSGNNQFFPGTEERICLITGSVQQLTEVSKKIMDRVSEKYESAVEQPMTRIVITPRDSGVLIGKSGATINQIQGKTGAKIAIGKNPDENFERVVTITGKLEQRAGAMKEIIGLIAETPTNMANIRLNYDDFENMAMGMPNHGVPQEFPFDKEKLKQTLMSGGFDKEQLKEHIMSAITGNMEGPSGPTFDKQQLKVQLMSAFTSISMGGPSGPTFDKQQFKEQLMSAFTGNSMGGPPNNPAKKQRLNPLVTKASLTINVPYQMVGWILGKGGSGIQEMTRLSNGAKFEFAKFKEQDNSNRAMRELTVTGDLAQVNAGHELVQARVDEYWMQNQEFY